MMRYCKTRLDSTTKGGKPLVSNFIRHAAAQHFRLPTVCLIMMVKTLYFYSRGYWVESHRWWNFFSLFMIFFPLGILQR